MTESMVVTKWIEATLEEVYDAWTDPALMSRWFFVSDGWRTKMTADLKVGGGFRIEMETDRGEHLVSTGTYLALQPPTHLSFSWSSYAVRDTTVTIDLAPEGNGTRLTLTHHGLPSVDLVDRHANGWTATLNNLLRVAGSNPTS